MVSLTINLMDLGHTAKLSKKLLSNKLPRMLELKHLLRIWLSERKLKTLFLALSKLLVLVLKLQLLLLNQLRLPQLPLQPQLPQLNQLHNLIPKIWVPSTKMEKLSSLLSHNLHQPLLCNILNNLHNSHLLSAPPLQSQLLFNDPHQSKKKMLQKTSARTMMVVLRLHHLLQLRHHKPSL